MHRKASLSALLLTSLFVVACDEPAPTAAVYQPALSQLSGSGSFQFEPIIAPTGSSACLVGAQSEPLFLPAGFAQQIIGRQSDLVTMNPEVNFDMLTLNETGPQAGRYLFRTHEVRPYAALSRIDLWTGRNELLVEREDWESFDGLVWTPWGTILMAEERVVQTYRDPAFPNIERGLVYEYFPETGAVVARPAIGARSHEGLRFDAQGNLYGISESRGIQQAGGAGQSGAIFKFVPDRRGDLSSGTLYALKVANPSRTGEAQWVKLDLDPVTFDSDAAAQAVGATGWDRPEDIEIGLSTGNSPGGNNIMYVAVTESSNLALNNGLVLKIVLKGDRATVSNYVEPGSNVPGEAGGDTGTGFDDPDNLALAPNGDLYITEDDAPSDIWVARGKGAMASEVHLFARLLDCGAETTGIYFSRNGQTLWVNSQHADLNGGDDLTLAITRQRGK